MKSKQNESTPIQTKYYYIAKWSFFTAIIWEIVIFVAYIVALFNTSDHIKAVSMWEFGVFIGVIPALVAGWADTKNILLRGNRDVNAIAKSAQNRDRLWLFTALHALASLRGSTQTSPQRIVIDLEGRSMLTYFPQVSTIPGYNHGKVTLIANGQEVEITRDTVESVPRLVIDAVEAALAEARAERAAADRTTREVLKSLA